MMTKGDHEGHVFYHIRTQTTDSFFFFFSHFFMEVCPRSSPYGIYILQLICFARVCSYVSDFNNRNQFWTAKLLKQGYRHHKIREVILPQSLRVVC